MDLDALLNKEHPYADRPGQPTVLGQRLEFSRLAEAGGEAHTTARDRGHDEAGATARPAPG